MLLSARGRIKSYRHHLIHCGRYSNRIGNHPSPLNSLDHSGSRFRSVRPYVVTTITTSNPQQNVLHLVRQVNEASSAASHRASNTHLILISSGLSSQIYNDDKFILSAVQALNRDRSPRDAIVGVVDRVSSPGRTDGLEGIALISLEDHEYDLDRQEEISGSRNRGKAQPPPVLSFHMSGNQRFQNGLRTVSVDLAVSNTIFQLGRPHFLAHYLFAQNGQISSRSDLRKLAIHLKIKPRASKTLPPSYALQTNAAPATKSQPGESPVPSVHFKLPIFALTPPLRVADSMGNIVRQVLELSFDPNNSLPSRPASIDLEQAVRDFARIRDVHPHPMEVYALVIPPDLAADYTTSPKMPSEQAIRTNWERSAPLSEPSIAYLLTHGASLHKVLSGGGEWGERAGLISLSYREDSYRSVAPEDAEISMLDFVLGQDGLRSVLNTVAPPGHFIQYFAAATEGDGYCLKVDERSVRRLQDETKGVCLGTIGDRDEVGTDCASGSEGLDGNPEILVSDDYLGVLTKQGLSISLQPAGTPNGLSSPERHQTQIEVPSTRLTVSLQPPSSHTAPPVASDIRKMCVSSVSSPFDSSSPSVCPPTASDLPLPTPPPPESSPPLTSTDLRILQAITSGTRSLTDITREYRRYSRAIRRYHENALLAAIENVLHCRSGQAQGATSTTLVLPGISNKAWPPLWHPVPTNRLPIEVPLGLTRFQTKPQRQYYWWEGLVDWKPIEAMDRETYVRKQIASMTTEERKRAREEKVRILKEWLDHGAAGLEEAMEVEVEQASGMVEELVKKAFGPRPGRTPAAALDDGSAVTEHKNKEDRTRTEGPRNRCAGLNEE